MYFIIVISVKLAWVIFFICAGTILVVVIFIVWYRLHKKRNCKDQRGKHIYHAGQASWDLPQERVAQLFYRLWSVFTLWRMKKLSFEIPYAMLTWEDNFNVFMISNDFPTRNLSLTCRQHCYQVSKGRQKSCKKLFQGGITKLDFLFWLPSLLCDVLLFLSFSSWKL